MALSNLFGWKKSETEAGSACGAACGAADKPAEKPAACGTACGAADKPEGSNRPGDDCPERTEAERRTQVQILSLRLLGRGAESFRNRVFGVFSLPRESLE